MTTILRLLPHTLLLLGFSLTAVIPGLTHDAPEAGFVAKTLIEQWESDRILAQKPTNTPTWRSHGGQEGCSRSIPGALFDTLLVVTQQGKVVRMSFDRAWKVTHDDSKANDVWVIGNCE